MLPQFLHYNNGKTVFFHLFSKINISFSKILSFSSGCGSKDSGDTLFRQAWRARSFGIRPRDVFHRVVAVRLLPEISLPGMERMGKFCPLAIIARRQGAGAWQERLPWGCQSIPNGRIRSACHVREAYVSDSKTMAVIHFPGTIPGTIEKRTHEAQVSISAKGVLFIPKPSNQPLFGDSRAVPLFASRAGKLLSILVCRVTSVSGRTNALAYDVVRPAALRFHRKGNNVVVLAFSPEKWWAMGDSNPRHQRCKRCALTN